MVVPLIQIISWVNVAWLKLCHVPFEQCVGIQIHKTRKKKRGTNYAYSYNPIKQNKFEQISDKFNIIKIVLRCKIFSKKFYCVMFTMIKSALC